MYLTNPPTNVAACTLYIYMYMYVNCLLIYMYVSAEPDSRIKNIKIRETAEHPAATVDDIKASVMSLRLGAISPGMKKATSTHSLSGMSSAWASCT